MRARHLFCAHSGNAKRPRKKARPAGRILQMKKLCNDNMSSRMAETPLFSNLSDSVRLALASELNVRILTCEAGELVTHECRPASEIVCVLEGRLHVYECRLRDGSRHLVHVLRPGEVYGASFPVLDLADSPGMLSAAERTRILVCDVERVRKLVRSCACPQFISNLYAAAVRQGFHAWRKLALLSCYEIADRILLHLKWQRDAGDAAPVRVSELAAYLGVNRTALYRTVNRLKKIGRVAVVHGEIELLEDGGR